MEENHEAAGEQPAHATDHAAEIEALRLKTLAALELAHAQLGVLIASYRWNADDNVVGAGRLFRERLGQAQFLADRLAALKHEAAEAAAPCPMQIN